MAKKITLFLTSRYFWFIGIVFALYLLINNATYYPVNSGYDAALHLRYADIISHDFRLPELTETREGYNPPLFYLISGLIIKTFSQSFGQDFYSAAKIWQYAGIILIFLSLYFWYQIIKLIYPKNRLAPRIFLLLLFSLPVFHKTIVMFSIELWFLFTVSLTLWFFILKFQSKPNLLNTLILGLLLVINLLTRMSAVTLLLTIFTGIIGLCYQKKISFKKLLTLMSLILVIISLGTGWFYIGRKDKDIYGVGEGGEPNIPFFQRQPVSFYTDIPFTLMMTYPMRQSTYINKLIPIFYSEFWGDYWNYYPQRRFGISIQQVRKNREISNDKRIKSLVLQNQINLLPTLLMMLGFIFVTFKFLLGFKKPNNRWLVEGMFLVFTFLTWLGFLALLTKYPSWKGDSIKPSYMLYNLPIFIYFLLYVLFDLFKNKKILLVPIILWLIAANLVNLRFAWF